MRLNNIQVAGLKAEAGCPTSEVAKTLTETGRLAYHRGIQDGRTLLARELLQAEVDANGPQPACIQAERPGSCRCGNCSPYQTWCEPCA